MAISRAVVSLVAILLPVQVSVAQSGRAPQQQHPPVKRVRVDLSGFDLGKQQPAGTQTGGGSRGGQKSSITLNAPRKGLAYTTHPVFQWQDSEQTREAVFRIFDASGDELFESTVPGRSLAYPEDAPELKPGSSYSWTVQHVGQLAVEPPEPAEITILPQAEREQLKVLFANDRARTLESSRKRAEIFVSKRLWYDAIEAYSNLITQYPKSAELYIRRGELYGQLPVTEELAQRDFRASEKLR